MIIGESHEVHSIFPPMPSTIQGALCTAMLLQQGIDPADFTRDEGPTEEVRRKLPLLGEPERFGYQSVGPVFHVALSGTEHDWLYPVPANWFAEVPRFQEADSGPFHAVVAAARLSTDAFQSLGLCGSVPDPPWVSGLKTPDPTNLCGYWTNLAAFDAMRKGPATVGFHNALDGLKADRPAIVDLRALYATENRVGIALDPMQRRARTGRLYSSSHVRLRQGIRMAVGLSEQLAPSHLKPTGIIKLGGEQKTAWYTLASDEPKLPSGESGWIMALSHIPFKRMAENRWDDLPRMSGPLIRMGGWDMKRNFHKSTTAYLPAGTTIRVGKGVEPPFGFIRT